MEKQFEEKISKKLESFQAFHVSRNLQSLEQNLVTTQAMKKKKNLDHIEVGKEIFLNFYVKCFCEKLEILEFTLNKNQSVEEIENVVNNLVPLKISQKEGTNFSYIFSVKELVKNYNLGDLLIKWKLQGRKFASETKF